MLMWKGVMLLIEMFKKGLAEKETSRSCRKGQEDIGRQGTDIKRCLQGPEDGHVV